MWAQTELSKPYICDHSSKKFCPNFKLASGFEIWNVFLKNNNSRKVTDQKIFENKVPRSIF